ncbi:MAG: DUF1015 domain-containing protein [Omnitrophica bacterium]|nr:DUF1015 domain-containing protein [Candidatus Omnitrophota bacterium]
MPDIRAFCGILYNPKKIKDLKYVVTEPYDVISPAQQRDYYNTHPHNIIRLILGRHYSGDNHKNNQYTRAKRFFIDWLKKEILLRDEEPAIYIYAQSFSHNNRRRARTGFIILLKLEDFAKNTVLPHENIFSQPVHERLELLKVTRANLSPIFALFSEPQGRINKLLSQHKRDHRPYITLKKDKITHKLWRMSNKRKIAAIKKLLKGKQIFIADGHHRYESALNYKMYMQRKKSRLHRSAPFNYVMTYLVATADPGLTILPTHRVIKIKGPFNRDESISNLSKPFEVHKFSSFDKMFSYMRQSKSSRIFSAYFGKNRFYGLRLKDPKGVYKLIDQKSPGLLKDLDVTILHSLIIEQILNIGSLEESIYYTMNAQEAIKLVDQDEYQLAFFLKATKLAQVQRMAKAGQRMPHKTTYFYPKLLTGLVINQLGTKD